MRPDPGPELGQECMARGFGLGRVTNLNVGDGLVGVTPYVAGYEMHFARHNVRLVAIRYEDGSPREP